MGIFFDGERQYAQDDNAPAIKTADEVFPKESINPDPVVPLPASADTVYPPREHLRSELEGMSMQAMQRKYRRFYRAPMTKAQMIEKILDSGLYQ